MIAACLVLLAQAAVHPQAASGTPLAGATVTATASDGSATVRVVTDASGNYSITLPAGFTGMVVPAAQGYVFSPSQVGFALLQSDTTQNFAAKRQGRR